MDDLSTLPWLIGMAALVLGPTGAVWVDIRRQVNTMVKQWDKDRTETREWLKSLEGKTQQNTIDIAVVDGILKDRAERAEA